ncbi:DUF115 domain-containing protein [Campylobacter sp. CNRCH_2013_0671h]|uniref:motility associated factor glycosyltransferase family protein n=1 Tax=Campylobacter sp. CNRCH_2013_0671h TaxID=2911599 RepID=UPI0021E6865B|nr:6-hydroxymethylpterin diphosphokinase MptE-like protein [Campylobacter sp. CNRCH_2013_0671h]EID4796512.1 motility associated factor glycosyltransferase family protein [Campylobacter lari]MCV3548962.1 DUF115 domain-containing protein [Campylobacter sp. CNRCH_2013_0671h]
MNHELFKKNIQSLNPSFQKLFKNIKKTPYKIIQGNDSLDINIKDKQGKIIYENPILELNTMLAKYDQMYKLYPVLYFFGFGNGILYKALLQNPNLKHIIVFEDNLELIYSLFFHIDFSKELKTNKLILAQCNMPNSALLSLMSRNPFREFIRTYFLEIHSRYYERFANNILNLNQKILSCIRSIATIKGTDTKDTLQGIEQFMENIPKMLSKPCLKELLNKRNTLSKNAIIVSTGPSLSKQLPLLKQYQDNVVIFCADSAYPILYQENIKPDYVFMVERGEITAEFFNNDFKNFDKNTLFILTSLVHPNAINYLEQNNRKFICISKETFETYFGLNAFGYVDLAISVAHLAFIFANLLNFKNIFFIGQDLAFNDLGHSHPTNYKHSPTYESRLEKIDTLAYGGKGYVKTHIAWDMFKTNLEHLITNSKAKIYNATEGGARIEGTIEKPFKEICKEFLKEKIEKDFPILENFTPDKKQEYLLKTYHKLIKLLEDIEKYLKKYQNIINFINNSSDVNITLKYLDELDLDDFKDNTLIRLLLACYLDQLRFHLAKIFVIIPKSQQMQKEKSKFWINSHLEYFQLIIITLKKLEIILLNKKCFIKDILTKNNLEKYIKK